MMDHPEMDAAREELSRSLSDLVRGMVVLNNQQVFTVDAVEMDRHRAVLRLTMADGEEIMIVAEEGRAIQLHYVG